MDIYPYGYGVYMLLDQSLFSGVDATRFMHGTAVTFDQSILHDYFLARRL